MLTAAGAAPGSPVPHGGMPPPCVLCFAPILWSSVFSFQIKNLIHFNSFSEIGLVWFGLVVVGF